MQSTRCVLLLAVAAAAVAGATADRVQMEPDLLVTEDDGHGTRLVRPSSKWVLSAKPPAPTDELTVYFMMRHEPEHLAALESELYAVSDPRSPKYGQHLSLDELKALLPVPAAATDAVDAFVGKARARWNHNRDIAEVTLSVADAERLFATTLGRFDHARVAAASLVRAVRPYSLPAALAGAVDLVGDLVLLPRLRQSVIVPAAEEKEAGGADGAWPKDCGSLCGGTSVTPAVLKQRYGITAALEAATAAAGNSMAVAEFQGQYYAPTDLTKFNSNCGTNVTVASFTAIGGGANNPGSPGVEAMLDVEYAGAVAGAGVPLHFIYSNTYSLLSWVQFISSMKDAPLVHSVSYGNDEKQQSSTAYMLSTNTQFQKAGARGLSILFASGDQGVCGRSGCGFGLFGPKSFKPDFPGGSPFITGVGGTNFLTAGTIGDESAWTDGGGGFSNTFAIPSFQTDVVAAYKKNPAAQLPAPTTYHGKTYPLYNNTGRGYPDVSALGGQGNPYCVVSGGSGMGVAGTSAAAPVAAAVFAKLNGVRLAAGKSALGWLNPFIYQNAKSFHDVTNGDNTGGSASGFHAIAGWDPATGVGTPDFAALVKSVQALP